ncbi:hypothetical protein BCR43DRAFT_478917 [Syncephalastrum racemosum]|uniref:HIG1 domain-containing protein n=1 Tax=Syncephalastrum racemosum TaxID=13706 RepID=A0A1X2H256_SYNRA|nr:hypothetical protein BCR43DRAFT_478917 [Syncephalastrum racemosum]
MRLTTQAEQDAASRYALKGFAIGMAWLGSLGFAASAVGQVALPWYRRVPIQNKLSVIMVMALAGGALKGEQYLVTYERRGREKMLDQVTQRHYEIFYGEQPHTAAAAK